MLYCRVRQVLAVVGLCASCVAGSAEENAEETKTDFADVNAVLKAFNPKTDKELVQGDGTWLEWAYPKGGKSQYDLGIRRRHVLNLETVELKFFDTKTSKTIYSDFFTRKPSKYVSAGSIIAYPRSDFEVERSFTYWGKNPDGRKVVMKGAIVSCKIILGYPNGATKLPTELVCCKTVENLMKSGMPIPDIVGKAGKIKPLCEAAKRRYGAASTPRFFTAANSEGKVQILILDMKDDKAKTDLLPASY